MLPIKIIYKQKLEGNHKLEIFVDDKGEIYQTIGPTLFLFIEPPKELKKKVPSAEFMIKAFKILNS